MRVTMTRYVEGEDRSQATLFPETLDEYIAADNPVRVVDVFVDELDLRKLGFDGMRPEVTGRPAYHPGTLLKIYIYGYLNRIQSSRRLERETQRNVELIWLTGRLMPDFKTIADFRKDNGKAIRQVCKEFVVLCRSLNLFCDAIVAHEVTNVGHDRSQLSSMAKEARDAIGIEELTILADRGYFSGEEILECDQAGITALVPKPQTSNNKAQGLFDKRDFRYIPVDDEYQCPAGQRAIWRFTTVENGMTLHKYWSSACPKC